MTDIEQQWRQQNEHMRNEILNRIVMDVVELWARKNKDYAGQQMFLGLKAQFCDINRKFWKLKSFLWDDKQAEFEDPIEVCKDMIGHLLMTIYFLERHYAEEAPGEPITHGDGPRPMDDIDFAHHYEVEEFSKHELPTFTWKPAPDCKMAHRFGDDYWRPADGATHEHAWFNDQDLFLARQERSAHG